ncbi:MAG: hypothetical protein K9G33_15930 [Sneathiella sp.]|nr:hypothetical protein [Sneathiella sp.]
MKYSFLITPILFITVSTVAAARDGTVTAAEGWNNSAGFQTSYDILTKSVIAELIEKKENGFYDGYDQNNSYFTYIGAQSNAIGNQVIFNGSVESDVSVAPVNCGATTATAVNESGGNSETATGGTNCEMGNGNAAGR